MSSVLRVVKKMYCYFSALGPVAHMIRSIVAGVRSILYRIEYGSLPRPEEFFRFGRQSPSALIVRFGDQATWQLVTK